MADSFLTSDFRRVPFSTLEKKSNFSTVQPTATDDASKGYVPGSLWVYSPFNAVYVCTSAAIGAARWAYSGASVPAAVVSPAAITNFFGLSGAPFPAQGNLFRQVSVPGISPSGLAADIVLAQFTMTGNGFDQAGRGITICAWGSYAANVNAKTVKLMVSNTAQTVGAAAVSGTTLVSSGALTTTVSGNGFYTCVNVHKYGASVSNTQLAVVEDGSFGTTSLALAPPALLTINEATNLTWFVTGNCATLATDIVLNVVEVNCRN